MAVRDFANPKFENELGLQDLHESEREKEMKMDKVVGIINDTYKIVGMSPYNYEILTENLEEFLCDGGTIQEWMETLASSDWEIARRIKVEDTHSGYVVSAVSRYPKVGPETARDLWDVYERPGPRGAVFMWGVSLPNRFQR